MLHAYHIFSMTPPKLGLECALKEEGGYKCYCGWENYSIRRVIPTARVRGGAEFGSSIHIYIYIFLIYCKSCLSLLILNLQKRSQLGNKSCGIFKKLKPGRKNPRNFLLL